MTENVHRLTENCDNSDKRCSLNKACAFPRKTGQANHISINTYHTRSTLTNVSVKTVPSFECKNKDNNSSYRSKLSKCIENHRHSLLCSKQVCHKSRDREPSRIFLRKVIKLLKCRKLRKGRKNTLIKGTPVSSVLYSVATNYKLLRLK